MVANSQNLIYPFFVIEYKGDGPSGVGSLWVTTNQCLGGSASCVRLAERFNRQLGNCEDDSRVQPFNSGRNFGHEFSISLALWCVSH